MNEVLLERLKIAAPVERDEGGLVKANAAPRCENLRGRNASERLHPMPARALHAFEKLESGKMNVAHEYDGAFQSLIVQRGDVA
jgi:hypothetical protein